jgi:TRAP-type mannitol/chloroaromatic compound transport system permease small subunit
MHALRAVLKAIDRLSYWSGRAVSYLIPVMILALVYEVISRYYFSAPTLWAQDVSIFCFGYIGLIGGAYVMREHAHINVDLVYARLKPRTKAILDIVTGLTALFFLALVTYYCALEAERAFRLGLNRPTDWAPPLGPFILPIAIGGALLWLQCLANLTRNVFFVLTGRKIDDAPLGPGTQSEVRV